jgi:phospholipid N-methyltransferase
MKITNFAKAAIKDYKRVGAIVPSSKYVAKKVAEEINCKEIIIEYGAGDGIISREILKVVSSKAKLLAFETNPDLFEQLKKYEDDCLKPINRDIREAGDYLRENEIPFAEAVVSGIPFSLMRKSVRQEIIKKTEALLAPGGIFVVYQTSPLILPILKKHFEEVKIKFEARNLPPYFIITAKKHE